MKRHFFIIFFAVFFSHVVGIGAQPNLRKYSSISVKNITGAKGQFPVKGGVPIAKGKAPLNAVFRLLDENQQQVPVQTAVLARWDDNSIRWLLVDFISAPPVQGTAHYKLVWQRSGKTVKPKTPVQISGQPRPVLKSGSLWLAPHKSALLRLANRVDLQFNLVDESGQKCTAIVDSVKIETRGQIRSTLFVQGSFRNSKGQHVFTFGLRASVFAGSSKIYLEPLIVVDSPNGVIQKIRELSLEFLPLNPVKKATISGRPAGDGNSFAPARLFQIDDRQFTFDSDLTIGKSPGWAEIDDGKGTVAFAIRDFWQQWPKYIAVDEHSLSFGLFPPFEKGTFDHMQPWYKYQYLFDGACYRLRTGQARRWQIWVDFSGDGASLAQFANQPPVLSADPEQAIATGVWGDIAAAGTPGMKAYDKWADNLFDGYQLAIASQRDYGAMNWGDWFGERQVNWGNLEYDTAQHILKQFARTGDPKYLYAGDIAARHYSEVDVIHAVNDDLRKYFETDLSAGRYSISKRAQTYPVRPGMVHQHTVGHVSGFYSVEKIRELLVAHGVGDSQNPYLCLDPYNLGHIWTQGMAFDYFLTGDPWMKETVITIGDNLAQLVRDRRYPGFKGSNHSGRVNGWTMLAIAGAFDIEPKQSYLDAMKLLADDALSEQDPNCGGWLYSLSGGHCQCKTRKHVGEATFISAIRLNGLAKYYQLTGDERIPLAIKRAVTHIINDTWQEQYSGWRYTSCPATRPGGSSGVIIMAFINSIRMNHEPEHIRVFKKAWKAKFEKYLTIPPARPGIGKIFSTTMYACPEAVNLLVNDLNAR